MIESQRPDAGEDRTAPPEPRGVVRRAPGGRLQPARGDRQAAARSHGAPAPQQFTPKFLVWVFSRYWKVAFPCGVLLAAGIAAALLYTYVPEYSASGLIKIEDTQPYIAFKERVGAQGQRFVRTQIELMRSPVVLREALADQRVGGAEHLAADPDRVAAIREKLEVRQVGGSELYQVSYSSPSADESRDVVTAVIKSYFARQSDQGYRRTQRVIDLLEKERARRQLEVERLQRRVIDLSREVTGKDPFGHNTMTDVTKAISPLASLHQELTQVEVRIEILTAELQSLCEADVVAIDPAESTKVLDMEVQMHPEMAAREQAIEQLRRQIKQRKAEYKDPYWRDDATYLGLVEALRRAERDIEEFRPQLRERLLAETKARRQLGGESEADIKRRELASAKIQERSLRRRFEAELADVQDSGGKGAELQFAKAELAREEKVFEMIAARKLALQTEAKAPPRVEVVDKVTAASTPIAAAPWKKLAVACLAAMAFPFGLALMREVALRRVTDADQLFEDTSLPVLGEIASFPTQRVAANPRQLPRRLRKDMFAFAESIDALRMSLMFSAASDNQRVVAVTSAVAGEGKTSVAVSLALSFANATGKQTLLIDGDMRDSSVQDFVQAPDGPGLAEVLSGEVSLDEAIQCSEGNENLYVLRAGRCSGVPHNRAQPHRFEKLIEILRGSFKTVIIDTPPVLGASESLSMCRAAELTTLCTRRGVSRVREVRLATSKLESAGANVAGAVLNDVPTRGYGYAYAYGYGYRDEPREIESAS